VVTTAVIIVIGVSETGHRVLAVEVVHSGNEADYDDLFRSLSYRGWRGLQLEVFDNRKGLRNAIGHRFQGARPSNAARCTL